LAASLIDELLAVAAMLLHGRALRAITRPGTPPSFAVIVCSGRRATHQGQEKRAACADRHKVFITGLDFVIVFVLSGKFI